MFDLFYRWKGNGEKDQQSQRHSNASDRNKAFGFHFCIAQKRFDFWFFRWCVHERRLARIVHTQLI